MRDPVRFLESELAALLKTKLAELRGIAARIQIDLREAPEGSEHWIVHVEGGRAAVERGLSEHPSFTLTAHVEDWRDLLEGTATLRACLIDGRLEVEGDLGLMTRLAPLIFAQASRET